MTKYRALTGLNYPSANDGKERRIEIGDEFDDMTPTVLKNELAAGNIEAVDKKNPKVTVTEEGKEG